MSKFTEIPRFILEEYLEKFYPSIETGDTAVFIGPKTGIIYPVDPVMYIWVETEIPISDKNVTMMEVPFIPSSTIIGSDNMIKLTRATSYETSSAGIEIPASAKAYFRKRDTFSTFIKQQGYDDYVNPNRLFTYIGEMYQRDTDEYEIIYKDMGEWAINALPVNNRKALLQDFLNLFFDRVYSQTYGLEKNLWNLQDPDESYKEYLHYLSGMYNVPELSDDISEDVQREYIKNIINFLKRKGTYASIFAAFRSVLFNNDNQINIYERWHRKDVVGIPLLYFQDFNYLFYYGERGWHIGDGLAGEDYYSVPTGGIGGSPSPLNSSVFIYVRNTYATEWVIRHTLNTQEPIIRCINEENEVILPQSTKIIDNNTISVVFPTIMKGAVTLWQPNDTITSIGPSALNHEIAQIFPVSDVYTPDTDDNLSLIIPQEQYIDYTDTMQLVVPSGLETTTVFVSADYIHTQDDTSSTWTITHNLGYNILAVDTYVNIVSDEYDVYHNLNTEKLIVQYYNNDRKRVYPKSIHIVNDHYIRMEFEETVYGGYVYLKVADHEEVISAVSPDREISVNTTFSPGTSGLITTYIETSGNTVVVPGSEAITAPEIIEIEFEDSDFVGNMEISYGDYTHYQTIPATTWEVEHNLDHKAVVAQVFIGKESTSWNLTHNLNTIHLIVQCFTTDNELIYPSSIHIVDSNSISVEFSDGQAGYALIKESDYSGHVTSPANEWNITHSLNILPPLMQIWTETGNLYTPASNDSLMTSTVNTANLYLETDTLSGYCEVLRGDYSYSSYITPKTTWNIKHNLNDMNIITHCYTYFKSGTEWFFYHNKGYGITSTYNSSEFAYLSAAVLQEYDNSISFDNIVNMVGYPVISYRDYLETITTATSSWVVTHNLDTQNLIVQCYDHNNYQFLPSNLCLTDSNNISVSTHTAWTSGYCVVAEADYSHTQTVSDTTWTITHSLNNRNFNVQCFDENYNMIQPNTIEIVDQNNCTITFSSSASGYANIKEENPIFKQINPDYLKIEDDETIRVVFPYTLKGIARLTNVEQPTDYLETAEGMDLTLVDENNLTVTFPIAKKGTVYVAEADRAIKAIKKVLPQEVLIPDPNTCTITFDSEVDGYASLTVGGNLGYNYGLVMSPHYKVELDLNNQPYGGAYILDEVSAEALVDRWESTRPACKYAHYHWLVAPTCDFSGEYMSLYNRDLYTANLYTRSTTSMLEFAEDYPNIDCYVHRQGTMSATWIIQHGLETQDIIVQCWDWNNNFIQEQSVTKTSDDVCVIHFGEAMVGKACILKSGASLRTTELSGTWGYDHRLGNMYVITEFDEVTTTPVKFIPANVELFDNDRVTATIEDDILEGDGQFATATYKFDQITSEKYTWIIRHNLGYVTQMVQVFDGGWNQIYPKNIKAVNENRTQITFSEPTSGHALIIPMGNDWNQSSLMEDIENGGYVKIGTGLSGRGWNAKVRNDLETPTGQSTHIHVTESCNWYHIKADIGNTNNEDITEIGLFSSPFTYIDPDTGLEVQDPGSLMFYSYCDPIFKPKDVEITVFYKIRKWHTPVTIMGSTTEIAALTEIDSTGNYQFTTIGGMPEYTYRVSSHTGISINSDTGLLTVVSAAYATEAYTITITSTDECSNIATHDILINLVIPTSPVYISSGTDTITTSGDYTYTGDDGVPPYTWSMTEIDPLEITTTLTISATGTYQIEAIGGLEPYTWNLS